LAAGETERLIIGPSERLVSPRVAPPRSLCAACKRGYLEERHPADAEFGTNGTEGLAHWFHDDGWFRARGMP
jgi:hypothetical protein